MILRHSSAHFRRIALFLKLTGCRPSEAASIQWENVHFDKSQVLLYDHKTIKQTGEPRVLPLVPVARKLLLWLQRHPVVSPTEVVFELLKAGPVNAATLAKQAAARGILKGGFQHARRLLGVTKKHSGTHGSRGGWFYVLPPCATPKVPQRQFVFLNLEGTAWNRRTLGQHMMRIRKRVPALAGVHLYQLRHWFGTRGIQNGTNLKMLSLLMGHKSTAMTERYIASAGLTDQLLQAAVQVNYDPQAASVPAPRRRHRSRTRGTLSRSQPLRRRRTAESDSVLRLLLRQLAALQAEVRDAKQATPKEPVLLSAHEVAYQLLQVALEENPALAQGTDEAVYEWLRSRPQYRNQLPPSFETFSRYLRQARRLIDAYNKREQRCRQAHDSNPSPKGN